MKVQPSYVEVTPHSTLYAGPDAVNLFRARMLATALRLYATSGIRVTRSAAPTVMLRMAKQYTGQTYKRGAHLQAAEDVDRWVATMVAAIPVTIDGRQV